MGNNVIIRDFIKPGDVGGIIQLHGEYYFRKNGFDCTFEPYVAIPLSEFVLRGDGGEKLWVVERAGVVAGSIAVTRSDEVRAQLRWYMLDESILGMGIGRELIENALTFAKTKDYKKMILWTVNEQEKAIGVYKKNGFVLVEEKQHFLWGKMVTEQCYEKDFD